MSKKLFINYKMKKAFLKNKSKNNKYIDNTVHIRLGDIINLIKMKLRFADYVDFNSEPIVVLHSNQDKELTQKCQLVILHHMKQMVLINKELIFFISSYPIS